MKCSQVASVKFYIGNSNKSQSSYFILGYFPATDFTWFYNASQKMSLLRLSAMDFFWRYAFNIPFETNRKMYALL